MPRRILPADPSIGERVNARRNLRGWSIRYAASRAGIAHTTWSRIERGERRSDRYMLAELAATLECSVTDLTGQPHLPGDRALTTAHSHVERVWRALVEIAPDEPAERPVLPAAALAERTELVRARNNACDYASAGQILPDLLADLHAAAAGSDHQAALRMLVRATLAATLTLRNLGHIPEATMAAERCRQAAERLGGPVELAVADWVRSHTAVAAGSFRRALTLTTRAADELDRHLDAPTAPEVLGMLRLTSAISVDGPDRAARAHDYLGEAARIAERTGETDSWGLCFGPTNVDIWRVGVEVDAGAPGRAAQIAQHVNPGVLGMMTGSRQAGYYVDYARALAGVPGQDRSAVRMLLTAERVAPQRARSSVPARDTARFLLQQSRRSAGGSQLIGLCERMGVAD